MKILVAIAFLMVVSSGLSELRRSFLIGKSDAERQKQIRSLESRVSNLASALVQAENESQQRLLKIEELEQRLKGKEDQ